MKAAEPAPADAPVVPRSVKFSLAANYGRVLWKLAQSVAMIPPHHLHQCRPMVPEIHSDGMTGGTKAESSMDARVGRDEADG